MDELVLQFLRKIDAVFDVQFGGAKVRGVKQGGRQRGAQLVRNAGRHFAHGRQAVDPLAVLQGSQVGRDVLNLHHAAGPFLHALGLQGSQTARRIEVKFIGAVAGFPAAGNGPSRAGLQARDELLGGLVEVANLIVFNQHHRGGQGI